MWSRLAEHAHLVAIDLPVFGHSERRDELLTPSAMGEFVARVVREFGLKRPHAVGPDIGTSTLLFAAAKHPGLLRSIVLGNGTAAVPLQIGSVLKDVVEAPSLELLRNIDPRKSVESVLAFVDELPNHSIVEMLCPLARCAVLVNNCYVKFRPVIQVGPSVSIHS
jgi:pimeloyl-ACP methyl ester carboxylesterase